ncbi:sigma-70 family RNA polymerase sigma factor [Winogradskyella sp.]|uniref:RNA polymerase sigma factor n=1 Tax=Winogradskyella sp. TaxID=1883156 RepID=UPI002605E8B5|nr:sigma-70 family RNA polymerase sigma factor [Winogradskyella sp.]
MNDPSFFLEGLISNNETVVKNIYEGSFRKVLSFIANNNGQKEDAEDIFQKALLQLVVRYKKERFVINTSFEAYLFTVCKNLWRRELNKSKKEVTNLTIVELKDDDEDIARAIVEQKRWELFTECLDKISDNCRVILKLFFEKVSYAKIVEKLHYNSETVARQRVFKCKNKLKELIRKDVRYRELTNI